MGILKKHARELFRNKRNLIDEKEKDKLDDLLLIQFQTLGLPFLQTMLSYWPIVENKEPNTLLITEYLRFKNPEIRIAYPVADFQTISLQAINTGIDTAFVRRELNIFEPVGGDLLQPEELDLVIVPMLCCDSHGFRIGYGKGFYDKYLAQCRRDCPKIGLTYFEPVDRFDDCNDFDVPLNCCVTPNNTYVF